MDEPFYMPSLKRAIPGIPRVVDEKFRRNGVHVVAGSGAGKSRWLGRYLVRPDFFRKNPIPTFVFDTGKTIDNFLHEMVLFNRDMLTNALGSPSFDREKTQDFVDNRYWSRIRYINMSGLDGYVVPLSLLSPLPGEGPADPAVRFVEILGKLYPSLEEAQVQGMPPLEQAATAAGELLTLTGGSLLDMADVVRNPDTWENRLLHRMREFPQLPDLFSDIKDVKQTQSLLTKLSLFRRNPAMGAIYGGLHRGIDLQRVIDNREVALFHFPPSMKKTEKRFAMLWTFWWIIHFLQLRGGDEEVPVSIVIDELSDLGNISDSHGQSVFDDDLNYLINTFMRGHNVWVTLAHQQMSQFSKDAQTFLFTMRAQIVGRAGDRDSALAVAREMMRYDPYKEKETRVDYKPVVGRYFIPHYKYVGFGGYVHDGGEWREAQTSDVEAYETKEYFAPIEQQYGNADFFEDLADLLFFRKTPDERQVFSIYSPDNQYAENDQEELTALRLRLMQRDGRRAEDVLAEIAARTAQMATTPPLQVPDTKAEYKTLPVRTKGKLQ